LLVAIKARPRQAGRGRGRPVGADSAETRARILRTARDVINERVRLRRYRSGFADRSMMKFIITARLEFHRSPCLRDSPGAVVSAVQAFYASMVDDAIAGGEVPSDVDAAAVVNMLLAKFLGMGFYAGFIVDRNDMTMIAKQLNQLMADGLLDHRESGPPLTITPPVPVTVAVDDFIHTWPGLTG
jgi:hypothetical protein